MGKGQRRGKHNGRRGRKQGGEGGSAREHDTTDGKRAGANARQLRDTRSTHRGQATTPGTQTNTYPRPHGLETRHKRKIHNLVKGDTAQERMAVTTAKGTLQGQRRHEPNVRNKKENTRHHEGANQRHPLKHRTAKVKAKTGDGRRKPKEKTKSLHGRKK